MDGLAKKHPLIGGPLQLGILTVDAALTIRTWDAWLASKHRHFRRRGARPARSTRSCRRSRERGLLPRFEQVLATGEVQVLAPALHHYLIPCPPSAPSPHFDRMQQRVTLGPLRDGDHVIGVMVTIEDVTARLDAERDARRGAPQRRTRRPRARLAHDRRGRAGSSSRTRSRRRCGPTTGASGAPRSTGLSRHADRDMLAALLTALRDEHRDFNVLSSALQLLVTSDVDVTAPLGELLREGDADLRIQAALALGEQRHPSAVGAAAGGARRSGRQRPLSRDRGARPPARRRRGRGARRHRRAARTSSSPSPAIDALAQISDGRVASRLVPLLARADIGEAVADALGELGGAEVVRPLVADPEHRRRHRWRSPARWRGCTSATSAATAAAPMSSTNSTPRCNRPARSALIDAVGQAPAQDLRSLRHRPLVAARTRGRAGADLAARPRGGARGRGRGDRAAGCGRGHAAARAARRPRTRTRASPRSSALGRLGDRRASPALTRLLGADRETAVAVTAALGAIGDRCRVRARCCRCSRTRTRASARRRSAR